MSESVELTVNVRSASSSAILSPVLVRTGSWLVSLTVIATDLVAERDGTPSSVAVNVTM